MTGTIVKLFDYLRRHSLLRRLSFLVLSLLLALQVMQVSYNEDISDFLPLEGNNLKALKIYQDIAGANRLFVTFGLRDTSRTDPDLAVEAIDRFVGEVESADSTSMITDMVSSIDMEQFATMTGFVYRNIPYFLDGSDYARMDSLLSDPGYVGRQLRKDKQMLMFPIGGIFSENLGKDPLNLFTPKVSALQRTSSSVRYEIYEGCIFTPDMKRGLVMLTSPFGSSETENNARLIDLLESAAEKTEAGMEGMEIRVIGGPVIAVSNASQIKTDSMLSVILAVTLILALLWFCFRNLQNLLLIALSIGWGWLFAMGGLSLFHNEVSVIAIGISSVILGIAVNYPLHLISHLSHTPDIRRALKEITAPLVIGNLTTIGAFLCLVPLESTALKDLGLFSSLLLAGTIILVLVYLPHWARVRKSGHSSFADRIGNVSLENRTWLVSAVILLTAVFGYYSGRTGFDTDMSHINYMTDRQKMDMAYLSQMIAGEKGVENLYVVSSGPTLDTALDRSRKLQPFLDGLKEEAVVRTSGCTQYLVSAREQRHRLEQWNRFISARADDLRSSLETEMKASGFSGHAFDEFLSILDGTYPERGFSHFRDFAHTLFASNLSLDSSRQDYNVIDVLTVRKEALDKVKDRLEPGLGNSFCFDVSSMNGAIARNLSDDFDYISIACGAIVFFFLWFSFGSIELAVLSFIPMLVSWIWILGIMGMLGIHFNIVNVILATFIFGQGDDYTIFMTEGCCYEYAYRKKMLASYKSSITISALIMFIGIGTLIFARHPALFSLAQVTIVGMFSVVLMASLLPPFFFRRLVMYRGGYRKRALSLMPALRYLYACALFGILLAVLYLKDLCRKGMPEEERRTRLRRSASKGLRKWLAYMPGIRFHNPDSRTEGRPSVVICSCNSILDLICLMAASPDLILIPTSALPAMGPLRNLMLQMGHGSVPATDRDGLARLAANGCSLCLLASGNGKEGRNLLLPESLELARRLQLEPTATIIYGTRYLHFTGQGMLFAGEIRMEAEIRREEATGDYADTDAWNRWYVAQDTRLRQRWGTALSYRELVRDRYRYKGADICRETDRRLSREGCFNSLIAHMPDVPEILVLDGGCGEFALLAALVHPEKKIHVLEEDEDKARLLQSCAEGLVDNLVIYSGTLPAGLQTSPGMPTFGVRDNVMQELN